MGPKSIDPQILLSMALYYRVLVWGLGFSDIRPSLGFKAISIHGPLGFRGLGSAI